MQNRAKILDDFAKAYLAERGETVNPSRLCLVEDRTDPWKTVYHFEVRRGRPRKSSMASKANNANQADANPH